MKFLLSFLMFISWMHVAAQDTTAYTTTEIIYGRKDGVALTMIKVTPTQNKNGKAIISLVSGNWNSNFSMAGRYIPRSIYLVKNGFTVFFVMHGSQPRFAINDQVDDVKRAVRFIKHNATAYAIDADHIGIAGSSSGGHLSLMVALTNDKVKTNAVDPIDRLSSSVQAAAVFFPPTDFINWGAENSKIDVQRLARLGVAGAFDFKILSDSTGMYEHMKGDENIKKIAAANSPIFQVSSDDPPILIFHGDADPVVPIQQSYSLIKQLNEKKVRNELIVRKGAGHGWRNDEAEEKKIIEWFEKFLK